MLRIAVLVAVAFRLDALSVWAALLSAAWKVAVGIAVLTAAAAGWRFFAKSRPS